MNRGRAEQVQNVIMMMKEMGKKVVGLWQGFFQLGHADTTNKKGGGRKKMRTFQSATMIQLPSDSLSCETFMR